MGNQTQIPVKVFIKPLNVIRVHHGHGATKRAVSLSNLPSFVFLCNFSCRGDPAPIAHLVKN